MPSGFWRSHRRWPLSIFSALCLRFGRPAGYRRLCLGAQPQSRFSRFIDGLSLTFALLVTGMGIKRFPQLYTRMQAASKAGTVGSGLLLLVVGINSLVFAGLARSFVGFCFVILTAPVSAHLLAKAAQQSGYRLSAITRKINGK